MAMTDFIQQAIGLRQAITQMEEQQRLERAQQANLITTYTNIARQTTNPELLGNLRKTFSTISGVNEGTFDEFGRMTAPTGDLLSNAAAKRGIEAMDANSAADLNAEAATLSAAGTRRGPLAQETFMRGLLTAPTPEGEAFRTRQATGMTPGEFGLDTATAELPNPALQRAAEMSLGLRMTAPQEEQAAQGWAGNRLGWAEMENRTALGQAGLQLDWAQMQAKAQQSADPEVMATLEMFRKSYTDFQAQKSQMSDAEQQVALNFINILKDRMIRAGVLPNRGDETGPLQQKDVAQDFWRWAK